MKIQHGSFPLRDAITAVLREIITFTAAAERPIRAEAHDRLAELLTPRSPPFLVPHTYSLPLWHAPTLHLCRQSCVKM